jgi:hypothetical protein
MDKPDGNCNYFLIPDKEQCDNAENKLGQLEDIEDELGIDLITLFKALKNGWFDKNRKYSTKRDDDIRYIVVIDYECKCIKWSHNFAFNVGNPFAYRCFYFKDYGKTWALTKEELEYK